MGEKQIRAHADQAGVEALRPMFDALADLAVAAEAAGRRDELRTRARAHAQRILDDAEAEVARRDDAWRQAWAAAKAAGWTVAMLRAAPISQLPPPATTRQRGRNTVQAGRSRLAGQGDGARSRRAGPAESLLSA